MKASRVNVLMYHDLSAGDVASRGLLHRHSYCVSMGSLAKHMRACSALTGGPPSILLDRGSAHHLRRAWGLTFDDGPTSVLFAAELLDALRWRAHFFIVGSWIGKSGYLTPNQILDLRARGHIIGSHSHTHPDPMSGLPSPQLRDEWRRSVDDLASLLGRPVRIASVPGGGYSSRVAEAAAEAGIEILFTSEPTSRVRTVGDCTIVGRYAIRRGTDARTVAAIASGSPLACGVQRFSWDSRKLAKRTLGRTYYSLRSRILDSRAPDED